VLSRVTPITWVVIASLIVGAGFGLWELKRENATEAQAIAEQRQQSLQRMLDGALQSVKAGDWRAADRQLSELMTTDPTFQMARVIELKSAANREVAVNELLEQTQDHLEKGDLAGARKALEAIAKDTAQGAKVDALREQFDRQINERLEAGRPLLTQTGEPEAMKKLFALAEEVLAAAPEQRDALAYRALAGDALVRMFNRREASRRAEPWADVQARFIAGDLVGAREEARLCSTKYKPCKTQLSQLLQFEKQYKKLGSASLAQIESLIALSRKISGGPMSALVRTPARSVSGDLMVKAHTLWSAGQPGAALAQAKKALAVDPDDAGAKRLIAEAASKAKDLYLQTGGYGESPDDIISRLQTIVDMTPANDEYHLKAKQRIEELKK
jgi:tetratricopeptide (TPR) repeat protein